jgi:4-amino-4-deoxy-L-arabinose transferase-like glycosyltransferase
LALLRLSVAANTGLTNDEAYYRLWSLAPALSYFDHPPMVAWLIALGRFLIGDTELGARFLAPVLLMFGRLVHWRGSSLLLDDKETALYAGWFFLAMPLLAIGGVILTPDLPSVLFYGLVLVSISELNRSQNANWWLATGIFTGLGLLSKYTNLFAGAAILLWLLATPANRKWFRTPQLWLGAALALILFLPVLIWNAEHGWASFAKQFGRVTEGNTLNLGPVGEMLGWYLALASPLIAVLALLGLADVVRRAVRDRTSNEILLAAAIVPMLGYFLLHALHSRVLPNWPAPVYPLLASCAAVGLRKWVSMNRQLIVAIFAVGVGVVSTGLVYAHAKWPLVHLKKDAMGEMRGWPAFTGRIAGVAKDFDDVWIVTKSFATTAQLSFALKDRLPVVQLGEQIRYENLGPVPDEILSKPALYVDLEGKKQPAVLRQCFSEVQPMIPLTRGDGTQNGAAYVSYQLLGFKHSCLGDQALHAAYIGSKDRGN